MRLISALFVLTCSFSALANTPQPTVDVQNLALQKAYLQTIDCRAPKRIVSMLKEAIKDTDNDSANASKASVFEELMIKNPSCFIQALNTLPPKACLQIQDTFIKETYFYPRDEIKRSLATAKNYSKSCIAG